MLKRYVIKNTENSKYFTNDYDGWWSLDVKDSCYYFNEDEVEKAIKQQIDSENDSFEKVTCVVIETIYIK